CSNLSSLPPRSLKRPSRSLPTSSPVATPNSSSPPSPSSLKTSTLAPTSLSASPQPLLVSPPSTSKPPVFNSPTVLSRSPPMITVLLKRSGSLGVEVIKPPSVCAELWAHLAKESVEVTRKGMPSATCYSNGDPHFKTFDGKEYSAQGQGVYYLVKTPSFIVQADQRTCATDVTCNMAVAIQYGTSVMTLTAALTPNPPRLLPPLPSPHRHHCPRQHRQIPISTLDRRRHSHDRQHLPWNGVYYLDISVEIAGSQFSQTDGLCGSFNNNPADDVPNPPLTAFLTAKTSSRLVRVSTSPSPPASPLSPEKCPTLAPTYNGWLHPQPPSRLPPRRHHPPFRN
ncbi:hypothetical protein BC829DRAFT_477660, partial [Chytridium lagenaria]